VRGAVTADRDHQPIPGGSRELRSLTRTGGLLDLE
jgi:hypothetical protein